MQSYSNCEQKKLDIIVACLASLIFNLNLVILAYNIKTTFIRQHRFSVVNIEYCILVIANYVQEVCTLLDVRPTPASNQAWIPPASLHSSKEVNCQAGRGRSHCRGGSHCQCT